MHCRLQDATICPLAEKGLLNFLPCLDTLPFVCRKGESMGVHSVSILCEAFWKGRPWGSLLLDLPYPRHTSSAGCMLK